MPHSASGAKSGRLFRQDDAFLAETLKNTLLGPALPVLSMETTFVIGQSSAGRAQATVVGSTRDAPR
jgi:hypothetical protein